MFNTQKKKLDYFSSRSQKDWQVPQISTNNNGKNFIWQLFKKKNIF